ncbi:DNA adenine methylase [Microvirga sp. 2YAF29]|uniref:DNA adenine methylase n=1 Tax=Microvirga sp. 2YAF29 TaxID=3233031 RepID=UPI003F946D1C
MTNFSPLRYPGGKGKLAPYLTEILELNRLQGGHYAEPFAGGAAVALDLLFSERVRHIHINDIDHCVYAFWYSVVHETDAFVAKIDSTPITVETWLQAREIKRQPASHDLIEVGFSTFFLNRTNRSGILNGGLIGGLSQKGDWKIDCRFNKSELISRVKRIGFYRSRISVCNLDAADFLSGYVHNIDGDCLIYIDPPYYVKGAYLYQNHYKHEDHVKLAEIIAEIDRHKWIVSYDNVEPIHSIYQTFEREQFDINYSARNHGKGTEVMVFAPGLARPCAIFSSFKERQLASRT